jgi:hypothetical protein
MKGQAKLTIGRTKDDWIETEIRDEHRKKRILSVYVDPANFTRAVTGFARQGCELEYNLDYNPQEPYGYIEGEDEDADPS